MLDLKAVEEIVGEESPGWGDYPKWAWEKPSLAVIVSDANGHGVVTWYAGPHLAYEIGETGTLGDLAEDCPGIGVYVWEGIFRTVVYPSSPNGPEEYDVEEVGKLRPPTEAEWQAIKENRCPWSETDWGLVETSPG